MLKKDSTIPLYKQLKNKILVDIQNLENDTKIDSEREYSEHCGISRITVRKAIDELVQEKYLLRITGKGTYVSKTDKSSEFIHVISYSKDMQKLGYNVRSKVLDFKIIFPNLEIKNRLELNGDEKVIRLQRLRYANDLPMAIQDSYINYKYCPNLLQYEFSLNSLYQTFENIFNLKLSYAKNFLESRLINDQEIKLFGLKKVIPVFILNQITFLDNGIPIEYVISIYRSDKYKFYNIAVGTEF